MHEPEDVWRRPTEGAAAPRQHPAAEPFTYSGPPPTTPPAQWVPAPVFRPLPPPRALPVQDHSVLDAEERRAQLVTLGVVAGMAALGVLALVAILIRSATAWSP